MKKTASRSKTNVRVDCLKVKRAQQVLGTKTELEFIEHALDFVIAEAKANRLNFDADQHLQKHGLRVKDVRGT